MLKNFKVQNILLTVNIICLVTYFIINSEMLLVIAIGISFLPIMWQILISKILKGNFGADFLAAIAIISALLLGEYVACVLVNIMVIGGKMMEEFATNKASSVLKELASRMPKTVRIKINNKIEEIFLEKINIKDQILILPHETCPADGIVIEGHSYIDESYLTGEPYGVSKAPGSNVLSGSINGEGTLLISVTKKTDDSRYAKIIKVIDEAQQMKPKIRRLADKLGMIFAPISLLIATFAGVFHSDPIRFLSVLVIATPCPLLIAVPVAIISSISLAAKKSIIITDPAVLENLPKCKTAIFDKTGTLTFGKATLTNIFTNEGLEKNEMLFFAASLEQYSKHPLATAIINAAKKENIQLREAKNVNETPGFGLQGKVDETVITITSRKNLSQSHAHLLKLLPPSSIGLECVMLINEKYAATFTFQDEHKPDSISFINHLNPYHSFEKIMLLSGDRESEVKYFANIVGIKDIHHSMSPEQKLQVVALETKKAKTLFMGDGINDAPALRAATVGVAFGEPSAVVKESAGAIILENTLAKVDELFHLSIVFRKIALQSSIGGIALSLIGMFIAFFGYLSPAQGAVLQQLIDGAAILNSLRILWIKEIKIDIDG